MSSEARLRDFLEYVVGTLAEHPEEVVVDYEPGEGKHVFRLRLNDEDVGRVIGRQGHTISSIRNLMSAAVAKEGGTVVVTVESEKG